MEINNNSQSLFNYIGDDIELAKKQADSNSRSLLDYIGNSNKSNDVLQGLGERQKQDISGGLGALDTGLMNGKFEETLTLLEKGEIDVDLDLVTNYYQFNKDKLDKEVGQLAKSFDLTSETRVTMQDGKLLVEGDSESAKALQQYLDKDQRLNTLVQQTGKLSQFVEWGEAKKQAAEYTSEDMPEEQVVDFLKDARAVVNENNQFILSNKGSAFQSEGHTQHYIDKIAEDRTN